MTDFKLLGGDIPAVDPVGTMTEGIGFPLHQVEKSDLDPSNIMLKSEYDLRNNGIVTAAALVGFECSALEPIAEGDCIALVGFDSNNLLPAAVKVKNSDLPSRVCVGIATQDAPNEFDIFIVVSRGVSAYNTIGFEVGEYLYLGEDSRLTSVLPVTPIVQCVGQALEQAFAGVVIIDAGFGFISATPEVTVPTIYPYTFQPYSSVVASGHAYTNDVDPAQATECYISLVDKNFQNRAARLGELDTGDKITYRTLDLANSIVFTVVDPATFTPDSATITVTPLSQTGTVPYGDVEVVLEIAAQITK